MLAGIAALVLAPLWEIDAQRWRFLATMLWLWGVVFLIVGASLLFPRLMLRLLGMVMYVLQFFI